MLTGGVFMYRTKPLSIRFWKYVTAGPFTECWLWNGLLSSNGYGRIGQEKTGRLLYTHRVSWELHNGPIPDDLCVCHTCDNRRCVNPYHLFLGTYADNLADMRAKGRGGIGTAVGGKLTKTEVIEIRVLRSQGIPQKELAKRFGVTQATIHRIEYRKVWKYIP
jgi:HNH endonuclease/Helix-turn-helix